uniref:Transmembrane protein 170B n=1 Tax=Cyprinus carpio TaxID=7962 RepID=A0A8C1S9Z2_CYPCA
MQKKKKKIHTDCLPLAELNKQLTFMHKLPERNATDLHFWQPANFLTEMWYWVFLWCLFSSLFVHSAVGLLMCVTLQRHKRGRLITVVLISVGFLLFFGLLISSISGAAVAAVYRVAGKDMAPLEALVFGVGQTAFTVIISFSRILATL